MERELETMGLLLTPNAAKDLATEDAVIRILKPCALHPTTSEIGLFILMSAANHLWPNPNTHIFDEQKLYAEAEAGKKIEKSSVELIW